MRLRVQTFCLPKHGSTDVEYEDAFYPSAPILTEFRGAHAFLAIADGATDSSYSREWAQLLVSDYAEHSFTYRAQRSVSVMASHIRSLGAHHRSTIDEQALAISAPWYVHEKASQGAFAAFVGVSIQECALRGGGLWRAISVGDCCVFHVRGEVLLNSFPMQSACEFNTRPWLLSSRECAESDLNAHCKHRKRHWIDGDCLLLMSDALAAWFLRRWELNSDPIPLINELNSQQDFQSLVESERSDACHDGVHLLKNDDVTLTRCLLGGN